MSAAAAVCAGALALAGGPAASAAATAPPSVTTGAVSAVTPTTASVTGTVDPNGAATTWYVQYGLETATSWTTSTAVRSAGAGSANESVTVSLTGLSPATSYRYRFVATSSAGTTDGTAGVFNTSAAPSVTTGAASAIGASSAILNGSVDAQGLATSWYFQYGLSTSYGSKTAMKLLAAGPSTTNVSQPVSGLAPHSTYHFRLVATSKAGTSFGTDFTLTTGLSVTLSASATSVVYTKFVNLSGAVASGKSGVQVTIMAERFNETSFSGIAAVTTNSGGSWSFSAQPSVRTTYEAFADGGTSSPIVVGVSPAVFLTVERSGALVTRVVGATSFAGHVLQLQRLQHGFWVTWKHVLLATGGRATFATSLPIGRTSIRMAIGPFVPGINQAGPGYLAGYSSPAIYVRK